MRVEKQITCLVALPTNQKEVLSFMVNESTTFEDLLGECWKVIFPDDKTPSYRDYYFLYLQPQVIIRVDAGEYVTDFGEFPRFLLRSRYHGIEGSVVSCILSEMGLKDVTVSFETSDSGVSVGSLFLSEDQEADCRVKGTSDKE